MGDAAFLEEALVRGGVVEGEKLLMRLVKLVGRPGQGQLVVIQTPLNVEMGFHQVHVALAPPYSQWSGGQWPAGAQTPSKASEMKAPPLSEIKWTGTP